MFHEHFASDDGGQLWALRRLSGLSVYLPPETLVNAIGLCHPRERPDLETCLRAAYALGLTPMFFTGLLPPSVDDFEPEVLQRFRRYARLYQTVIRPLLPTSRVYHHAPVNADGGVESGDWLALQFVSPDRTSGWATIIYMAPSQAGTYHLRLRGLTREAVYRVTYDNSGRTETKTGADLMEAALDIRAESDRASELVLFSVEAI
jgi:hypothetical protein